MTDDQGVVGLNLFVYSLNNPVNGTDSEGTAMAQIAAAVIGGVWGGISAMSSGGDEWDIALGIGFGAASALCASLGAIELSTCLDRCHTIISLSREMANGEFSFMSVVDTAVSYFIDSRLSKFFDNLPKFDADEVVDLTYRHLQSVTQWASDTVYSTASKAGQKYVKSAQYKKETERILKASEEKFKAIYNSMKGDINNPCRGNYKWL